MLLILAVGATYVIIGVQYDNDDPAKAASIVSATLSAHPDLKGIFATNLFSAEGAATALRQRGKLGQVKIVGFDAGPKQVRDLRGGVVQALIAQKPGVTRIDCEKAPGTFNETARRLSSVANRAAGSARAAHPVRCCGGGGAG